MSHPLTVRRLRAGEKREVEELARSCRDASVVRRAKAVQLSALGWKVGEIGELLDRDRSAVARWIRRFNAEGLDALTPRKSPGRPPRADENYRSQLRKAVETNPLELGYSFSRWTLDRLAAHLKKLTKVELKISRLGRILKEMGIRYGRPRLDLEHRQDPQQVATAKRLRTRALKKRPNRRTTQPSSTLTSPNSI